MVNAYIAGAALGAALTAAVAHIRRRRLENALREYMEANAEFEAENRFLHSELQIAVSISKRLNEALADKFAGVYGVYPNREIPPAAPDAKEAYTIGNETFFIHPRLAQALTHRQGEPS